MKKILILFSLVICLFACGEKKSKIELIENIDFIYLTITELKSTPILKNDINEINNEIKSVFEQKIKNIETQPFPIVALYMYFVGNNGRIEKITPAERINNIKAKGTNLPENYLSSIEPEILKILEKVEFTSDSTLAKFRGPLFIGISNVKGMNNEIKGITASVSFGLETYGKSFDTNRFNSNPEDVYFVAVEDAPSPIGGMEALMKKITYPETAKRAGTQGRVFVKAFIDEKGNVVKSEIIKGIDPILDQTALDAVSKTKFIPGKQRGIPVKTQVSIPIIFKLTDKDETSESNLGTITGKITDKNNSEISAANLFLEGTTIGSASDFFGKYVIKKIPPDTYKLKVTHPEYKTKIINVNVTSKTNTVNIVLEKK